VRLTVDDAGVKGLLTSVTFNVRKGALPGTPSPGPFGPFGTPTPTPTRTPTPRR
jgi:hypothetical protein